MIARLKILLEEPRGAAWPSSARGANCQVKSCNERDPYALLLIRSPDRMHTAWTARVKWEEGEGDGRSVWPESLGATRGIQCLSQWAATPKGEANPPNISSVRIEG